MERIHRSGPRCQPQTNSSPRPLISTLVPQLKAFRNAAVAPSTCPVYKIGIKKFNSFCEALDVLSFPPVGLAWCLFATNLAQTVAFKTVKLYITGVKFHNTELRFKGKIPKMTQLQLTLRGIKLSICTHGPRKQHLPIMIVTLKLLRSYLARSNLNSHDKQCAGQHSHWPFLVSCVAQNMFHHPAWASQNTTLCCTKMPKSRKTYSLVN